MRGLNNPEIVQIKNEKTPEPVLLVPENKLGFLDTVRAWWAYRKQYKASIKLAEAMANGTAPHGRTHEVIEDGTPGMGGAIIKATTKLVAKHIRNGEVIGERIVHNRVVTNGGRDAIVDAFTGAFTLANFNYHDWGTGTGDEAATDTGITAAGESRVSGTQSQPTSDVYQSVATITATGSHAITEHGLFSASTSGTLLDRTKFAAINVASGDSIQFTFTLTFASGG